MLLWMIEGCLRWQREGLVVPEIVQEDTAEYLQEMDDVTLWFNECCAAEGWSAQEPYAPRPAFSIRRCVANTG